MTPRRASLGVADDTAGAVSIVDAREVFVEESAMFDAPCPEPVIYHDPYNLAAGPEGYRPKFACGRRTCDSNEEDHD
jgi:hypothetical protein